MLFATGLALGFVLPLLCGWLYFVYPYQDRSIWWLVGGGFSGLMTAACAVAVFFHWWGSNWR